MLTLFSYYVMFPYDKAKVVKGTLSCEKLGWLLNLPNHAVILTPYSYTEIGCFLGRVWGIQLSLKLTAREIGQPATEGCFHPLPQLSSLFPTALVSYGSLHLFFLSFIPVLHFSLALTSVIWALLQRFRRPF